MDCRTARARLGFHPVSAHSSRLKAWSASDGRSGRRRRPRGRLAAGKSGHHGGGVHRLGVFGFLSDGRGDGGGARAKPRPDGECVRAVPSTHRRRAPRQPECGGVAWRDSALRRGDRDDFEPVDPGKDIRVARVYRQRVREGGRDPDPWCLRPSSPAAIAPPGRGGKRPSGRTSGRVSTTRWRDETERGRMGTKSGSAIEPG